jgi:WD40 repeat protein/thiol-disulfide isomerase/thioredoxin
VPALLLVSTVKAGTLFAAGQTAAATGVAANAAVMAEGVMKVMSSQKVLVGVVITLALGLVGTVSTVAYKGLLAPGTHARENGLEQPRQNAGANEIGGQGWQELRRLLGHGHFGFSYVKFSADGRILATVGQFGPVKFWDTTSWTVLGLVRLHQIYPQGWTAGVLLSPDGKSAVVAGKKKGEDGKPSHMLTLVNVPSGTERAVIPGGQAWYSPDGKFLAVGSEERIALYEVTGARKIADINPEGNWILASPNGVRFSPDGRMLASSYKGKVMLWNVADGKTRFSWDGYLPSANADASPFSPDGKMLVVAAFDRTIHLVDITTGKKRAMLAGFSLPYVKTAFSRDGELLLTAGHFRSNAFGIEPLEGLVPGASEEAMKLRPVEIKLWDVATGKERLSMPGETFNDDWAKLSGDGKTVIYQCAKEGEKAYRTVVWDVAGNQERMSVPERLGALSPDGFLMETWNGAEVTLWDLATGRKAATLSGGEKRLLTHADFSPDGSMLVTSSCHFDPKGRPGEAEKVPTEIKLWRRMKPAANEARPAAIPKKAPERKEARQKEDRATAQQFNGPSAELQRLQFECGSALSAVLKETAEGAQRDESTVRLLEEYARRALALAEKAQEEPEVIGALEYASQLASNPYAKLQVLRRKSIDQLAGHLGSEEIARVFPALTNLPFQPAEQFLRKALTRSTHRAVKAQACLYLAQYLQKQSDTLRLIKQQPELSRGLERSWGPEIMKQWPSHDPEISAKEADELYTRVTKEYADIQVTGRSLGEAAEAALFELRNLAVGKVAPEIEGEDLDGRRFKLTDYRGKVVVLDFWGHWCGPCRRIYSHGKALVKRMEGKPFAIVGVNSDANADEIRLAAKKEGISWRFWMDGPAPGPIAKRWNVESWPTIYVLDARGVIRFKQVREKALDNAVDVLVKEQEDLAKTK